MKRFVKKGSSSRHMLTLMTGTSIAQAIPVAISPILTRLYTPEEMGLLGIFMAVVAILSVGANGKYELAVQLADDDDEAMNMAALGVLLAAVLSIVLLLVVLLFRVPVARTLGNDAIAPWLFLVPAAVFLGGVQDVLFYLNSRAKRFSTVARSHIYKSLVLTLLQTALGAAKAGAGGLIWGQVASLLAANAGLYRGGVGGVDAKKSLSWSRIRAGAAKHIDLPKFTLLAGLANALSLNATTLLMSGMYTAAAVGYFVLVQRVLGTPVTLVGKAVGQVFFQRAVVERRSSGSAVTVFRKTSAGLLAVSVPIFLTLYVVAEPLFALLFGEPWRVAGRYAEIMVPMFAVRFVVSPLSLMNQVNRRNRAGLIWQIIFLGVAVTVLVVSGEMDLFVEDMLIALSASMTAVYSCFYLYLFRTTARPSSADDEPI